MTSATKSLTYRIGADLGDLRRKMEETTALTAAQRREFAELERQQRSHRAALTDLGQGMTAFGAATAIGLGLAAKAAIDWESAFTGVRKTVDGSDAEIASLEKELRGLARTLPATHEEIAGVAEAAGQLGIKRQDIAAFTKTMIDLGNTTNLTAEDAATDLAKFSNIMGTSAKDVDRLGASLVALGNDGASTEKDIIEMGLRIAGAGKQIGLTEAQVLGIASALSSVGIAAESGGSSISTTMIKIATAVQTGGEQLDTFAKVAGMSGQTFADAFHADAGAAIVAFVQGLGKMQKSGQDVFGVLDQLGLSEIRVRDALLRSGAAADMFTHSINVGSKAWAENKALTDEANKRYETAASRLQVAGNQMKDALIDVGAAVAPAVSSVTGGLANMVRGFQGLPGPMKEIVTWVGLAVAGITTVGGAALIAAPKIMAFRESMSLMAASGGLGSKALAGFGRALVGPLGLALTGATVLLGIFAAKSGAAAAAQENLRSRAKQIADAIIEENGAITANVIALTAKNAAEAGLLKNAQRLGIEGGKVTEAILDQGTAYEQVGRQLKEAFEKAAREDPGSIVSGQAHDIATVMGKLKDLHDETQNGVKANQAAQNATKGTVAAQKELAGSAGESAGQLKAETDALNDLIKSLDEAGGRYLDAREAQRALVEETAKSAEVLAKNHAGLDINTEKGRENARQLDAQAEAFRKLAEAAARDAEQMGGATAGAAALDASLAAARPQLLKIAEGFGMSASEAQKFVDRVLSANSATAPSLTAIQGDLMRVRDAVIGIPPGKTINIAAPTEPAIAKLEALGFKVVRLPNGTVNVTAQTGAAQGALDDLVRRNQGRIIGIRVALNTAAVGIGGRYYEFAGGGIFDPRRPVHAYAGGGMEDHRPQIANSRPGAVRVWAEPATSRESYIPWAMDRRSGATQVLADTAAGFGYDLAPRGQMAGGGAAGGGATTVIQPIVQINPNGEAKVAGFLIELLAREIKTRGGNVQTVLGG